MRIFGGPVKPETILSPLEKYLLERVRALTTELNSLKVELQSDACGLPPREDQGKS
jgi:hypothetical protein